MKTRPALLLTILSSTLVFAQAPSAPSKKFDFESDTPGKLPSGFSTALTGAGGPVHWEIKEDATSPSGKKVLAQTSADPTDYRFPLAVLNDVNAADVELSVRIRPVSGRVDQGAGLIWRYQNDNNYYIVRANALENNVVLYKVQNGRRTDLPLRGLGRTYGKPATVPSGQWSVLAVTARGSQFQVSFNGQKLYDVDDTTFTSPGRVGLWTKADSVMYFDDFTITIP